MITMTKMKDILKLEHGNDIVIQIYARNMHGTSDDPDEDSNTSVKVETVPYVMEAPSVTFKDGVNVEVAWQEPKGYTVSSY